MGSIEDEKKLHDFENRVRKLEMKLYGRTLIEFDSRQKVLEPKYQD